MVEQFALVRRLRVSIWDDLGHADRHMQFAAPVLDMADVHAMAGNQPEQRGEGGRGYRA